MCRTANPGRRAPQFGGIPWTLHTANLQAGLSDSCGLKSARWAHFESQSVRERTEARVFLCPSQIDSEAHQRMGESSVQGRTIATSARAAGQRAAMQGEGQPTESTRSPTADEGVGARQIAERAGAAWRHLDTVLSPIIGHGGVAALYRRSLFLVCIDHSWLPGVHEGALDLVEFTELESTVAAQSAPDAQAATQALVNTFRTLLCDLIGDSLMERLLRSVPHSTSRGDAVQDTRP